MAAIIHNPRALVQPAACLACGSRRRWRQVYDDGAIGVWRCWRCCELPAGSRVDIANAIHGEARAILCVPVAELTDATFARDLAVFGAPIAMDRRPPEPLTGGAAVLLKEGT
jgi:hypothetical protein